MDRYNTPDTLVETGA